MYRGREVVAEHQRTIRATLDLHIEPVRLEEAGSLVGVVGEARAKGASSGAEVEARLGYVIELDGEQVVRIVILREPEAALAALGRGNAP